MVDFLSVSGINKRQQEASVLKDVSFTQQQFQKIAIAGETGSGKSTLLKIIAGLEQADSGTVFFQGKRVKGLYEQMMPGHPGIAYLSQYFELRNNYRMEELLAYANKLSDETSEKLYDVCRIRHLLKRKNSQLSGGEKQRVALAVLLTTAPSLLLLDEPYSNLDMIHKQVLKQVIRDIGDQLGTTCALVSHDPMDLLSWAEEILVMKAGQIIQKGTPEEVYKQPVNEYVAGLFGKYHLISQELAGKFSALLHHETDHQVKIIRPEQFTVVADDQKGLQGKVSKVAFLGGHYEIEVQLFDDTITLRTDRNNIREGETVYVALSS